MASNTRRRKTKLDSSLSEEKLLKENKYFDLSFDDLKDVKFNFVDTKMSEKMQIQQTEENLEQHIEEILNDFMSGNTIDMKFVMKVLFLTLFGVKSQMNIKEMLKRSQKIAENVENIEKSVGAIEKVLDQNVQNVDRKSVAIEDIEKKVEDIDRKVVTIENVEKKVKNIDKKIASLKEVDKKVEDMDKKFSTLDGVDQKVIALQIESHSKKFLLKQVPTKLEKGEKRENVQSTKKIVQEILAIADMDLKSIDQVYRMYPNENSKKSPKMTEKRYPNILLKFTSDQEIFTFTKKLKDIKQVMKFKDLQFEKYVPKCLMNQWNCANLEAFRLRKRKMRTLTIIKNDQVQLLAKEKQKDDWIRLDNWKITN